MARTFDHVDDNIAYTGLPQQTTFSVSAWFRNTASNPQDDGVFSARDGSNFRGWNILIDKGGAFRRVQWLVREDGSSNVTINSATSAAQNTWVHVLGTFIAANATGSRLYIDGSEDANSPGDSSVVDNNGPANEEIHIGCATNSPAFFFEGDIGPCAIWTGVALSAAEAVALSKGVSPLNIRPDSLAFYAPLFGDQVNDWFGRTGTNTGSVVTASSPKLFHIPQLTFSIPTAAGGDVAKTPTAGTIALSGVQPTVTLQISISPTAGAIQIAGVQPSVSLGLSIAPTAGGIALSGVQPTATLQISIAPTAGAYQISGVQPTVDVASAGQISPTAGAIALSGIQPTVTLQLNIAPVAGSYVVSGVQPTVTVTAPDVAIAPTAGAIALSGVQPTVTLAINIAPSAGVFGLTGTQPDIVNTTSIGLGADWGPERDWAKEREREQRRRKEIAALFEELTGEKRIPEPEEVRQLHVETSLDMAKAKKRQARRLAAKMELVARLEVLTKEISVLELERQEDDDVSTLLLM